MAAVTRTNPAQGAGSGFDHDEQYSVANLKIMELDAGATLAAKDGIGGFIETMAREFQPLMYKSASTNGKIVMVVDGHGVTATSMQERLQAMGTVDGIACGALTIVERDFDTISFS
tara:strand:- start:706 stop:1053 length:348 start_codon:yes stop_codon:yes gene_type:complete